MPRRRSSRHHTLRHRTSSYLKSRNNLAVVVSGPERKWEYVPYKTSTTVNVILRELNGLNGKPLYQVEYDDGIEEEVSFSKLMSLKNGSKALDEHRAKDGSKFLDLHKQKNNIGRPKNLDHSETLPSPKISSRKRPRRKINNDDFINSADIDLESEEDSEDSLSIMTVKSQTKRSRLSIPSQGSYQNTRSSNNKYNLLLSNKNDDDESDSNDDELPFKRLRSSSTRKRLSGSKTPARLRGTARSVQFSRKQPSSFEKSGSESDELGHQVPKFERSGSFAKLRQKNRGRWAPDQTRNLKTRTRRNQISNSSESSDSSLSPVRPTRRSSREKATKNMKEQDLEDIYAEDDPRIVEHKALNIAEIFILISHQDPFRKYHNTDCDICNRNDKISKRGVNDLVFCQGCSTSIHQVCLGNRSSRDHIVTKIGTDNFVMQCRRCIGIATKKDVTAPRLDICQVCREVGPSCKAFSTKKSARQDENLRQNNGGEDPITEVSHELVNNANNILFRCVSCQRAFHFEHLPSLKSQSQNSPDKEKLRKSRLQEYHSDWRCQDCRQAPSKVQGLVCWKPINSENYIDGQTADEICEDEKEYLIKWTDKSYFECSWMPGSWVWGITVTTMRKAFLRRDEGLNMLPKWTFEEAIPEEYLRIEIVLDARYNKEFIPKSEKNDKSAIEMIIEVFVKFQGLPYDEAVWVKPLTPEDTERYNCFVAAYNDYINGLYFKLSSPSTMHHRLEAFRKRKFAKHLELKQQPSQITGGKMMPYQLDGLNWLLYNFHQKKNVILADEMGLGKTIQIISLFAALVKDRPKCWPFLVVTPNSTCPNWRREIKKWAPSLRVVSYYGSKAAREIVMDFEMYPKGCSDLRAHIVVTSFEAPTSDHCRPWFNKINWAGLVVDEGQRLKNDGNLLYIALKALKAPFRVLLTGTPLQNNKRELFNLLQFLDSNINAAKLDEEYEELTNANLPELHDLIRPFFLRRTKLQVLNFLPPMAQMIIPVTMTVVQKKLYKSILAKNPDLIQSIFGQQKKILKPSERGNLNNILMHLRKCLCHPFLYSSAIEERSHSEEILHRNLIDASSKFQLLEIMLPKLHERGHRVLIFSQFLNHLSLIEDLLNGLMFPYQRLDGTISSLEKQKRIDAFNAPNSNLFAFLLSTRAGGVGINLATADTPHQDIQAISRAHRIGQEKKVLVFQLMTKDSAEEKIIQIGRKKMALDKALIGNLDTKDDAGVDLESILRFGAEALFNDNDQNDIRYDSASVDKLLDRTLIETNKNDHGNTAEAQFSFSRIWANEKGSLDEYDDDSDSSKSAPKFSAWDKILEQREADAALEAAKNTKTFGRGKRSRQVKNYVKDNIELDEELFLSPSKNKKSKQREESVNDLDFADVLDSNDEDSDFVHDEDALAANKTPQKNLSARKKYFNPSHGASNEGEFHQNLASSAGFVSNPPTGLPFVETASQAITSLPTYSHQPNDLSSPSFHQVEIIDLQPFPSSNLILGQQNVETSWNNQVEYLTHQIPDSRSFNNITYPSTNQYPVSFSDQAHCNYCGLGHHQISRICPNFASSVQIRLMLDKIAKLKVSRAQKETAIEIILRRLLAERLRAIKNSRKKYN